MWCGAKFEQGHRCMRSQLSQLLVERIEDMVPEPEEVPENLETKKELQFEEPKNHQLPVISLHALLGIGDPQTLRI